MSTLRTVQSFPEATLRNAVAEVEVVYISYAIDRSPGELHHLLLTSST